MVLDVSDRTLRALTTRAAQLAEQVELATRRATSPEIRREGARFAEVLEEWLDRIRELKEGGDENLRDTIQSFNARLTMAENKVKLWYSGAGAPLPTPIARQSRSPKLTRRDRPRIKKAS
jgi:hypothetical protein